MNFKQFQITFGLVAVFLLSYTTSTKLCNNRGDLVEGNKCLCKEEYTGEKCEIEIQHQIINDFDKVQKQFLTSFWSKLNIQRIKREVVDRVDQGEESGATNLSEPNEGSTTDQPEQEFATDQPEQKSATDQSAQESATDQSAQASATDQPEQESATDQSEQESATDQSAQESATDQSAQASATDQPERESATDQPAQESTTDQPEQESTGSLFISCPAEQIYLSEQKICERALLFQFEIRNKSGSINNNTLSELLKSTLDQLGFYETYLYQDSTFEMNGVLAFNISSRTSLDIIVVALEEIAQDQLEFVVEDANECDDTNACDPNQDCQNAIGSYSCSCKKGFVLNEVSINEVKCNALCSNTFCSNGGKCLIDEENNPLCSCPNGYGGQYCGESIKPWWEATIALAAVAGALIIFLILFMIVHVCLNRSKKSDNSENDLVLCSDPSAEKASAPPYGGSNDDGNFNGSSMAHTTTTFKPADTEDVAS